MGRRTPRGVRLLAMVAGLNLLAGGSILAGGYAMLHTPNARVIDYDSSIVNAHYPTPRWLLHLGMWGIVVGVVLLTLGWLSSAQWRPGDKIPPGLHGVAILISFVLTGTVVCGAVVIAGASEGRLGGLGQVVWPVGLCSALALWALYRWRNSRTPPPIS